MHTDESCGVADLPRMVEELGPHLLAWKRVYNPAAASGVEYRTPLEVARGSSAPGQEVVSPTS